MENRNYFVHVSSYIDDGVEIGIDTKIWHFCHVQSGAKIGKKCSLGQNINISNNVRIGNYVKIQNNVSVYEGVEIEDNVFCGPSVVFTNDINPRSLYPKGRENYKKTLVQKGATLGANSTIVCGNIIGKHALIGAGAVVTKNIKDYAVVVGNPAKQIGWICECGQILNSSLQCQNCHKKYKETVKGLEEI